MRNYEMRGAADCGCGGPREPSYNKNEYMPTMAYVPWQFFETAYETERALEVGTIFPELYKPFLAGGRCCR